ncbi:MAG: hypothetical protein AAF557_27745 [Pseudomonadota bacterium]
MTGPEIAALQAAHAALEYGHHVCCGSQPGNAFDLAMRQTAPVLAAQIAHQLTEALRRGKDTPDA